MRQIIDGDDVLIIIGRLLAIDERVCLIDISTFERFCSLESYLCFGQAISYTISIIIYLVDES